MGFVGHAWARARASTTRRRPDVGGHPGGRPWSRGPSGAHSAVLQVPASPGDAFAPRDHLGGLTVPLTGQLSQPRPGSRPWGAASPRGARICLRSPVRAPSVPGLRPGSGEAQPGGSTRPTERWVSGGLPRGRSGIPRTRMGKRAEMHCRIQPRAWCHNRTFSRRFSDFVFLSVL